METESSPPVRIIRFGVFEVDLGAGELRKSGMRIKLHGQPLEILAMLLQRPGEVIPREDLRQRLWPTDTFVDFDHGLNTAINRLREALGDSAENPRFIETVPRRGYRFVAPLEAQVSAAFESKGRSTTASSSGKIPAGTAVISRAILRYRKVSAFVWIVAIALVVGLSVRSVREHLLARSSSPRIQSLAVLPLMNLSDDPGQDYFADGMTEALTTDLGKIGALRVISRTSVMQYKGTKKPLPEIARELNVDALIEGTVARSGDHLRITANLIQASPEKHLWAESYESELGDILTMEGQVAQAVAAEIQLKLTPEERKMLGDARPVNPEAHDEYLRGRSVLAGGLGHLSKLASKRQYTEQDIQTAIAYFKSAIDKDPAYAQAYAGLADAYIHWANPSWGGGSPKKSLSDAKEAATTALKLDPSLPEAHFSLAQTLQYDWNWPEAEKEYKLALKLNPNYVDAHLEYGRFVQALGRNDEALTELHFADELDPFNIGVKEAKAWVTYAARQYDLALKQFENLGDDNGLIQIYKEKGMYPEALAVYERWAATDPSESRDPYSLAVLASIYGLQGRNAEAAQLIEELKETARHRYVSGFLFAEAYIDLGQRDQAINWLERAYEEHDQWMVFANSYPGLDPLRSEPRFQALLRRMHFPPAH